MGGGESAEAEGGAPIDGDLSPNYTNYIISPVYV